MFPFTYTEKFPFLYLVFSTPKALVCSFYWVITLRLEQGFESLDFRDLRVTIRHHLPDFHVGAFIQSHSTLTELEILLISGR